MSISAIRNDPAANLSWHVSNFNTSISDSCNEMDKSIVEGECSKWNYIWLIPTNIVGTIVGLMYVPIAILANLLACAIFHLAACCTSNFVEKMRLRMIADMHLAGAVAAAIDNPIKMIVRVGDMRVDQVTTVADKVFEKLLDCRVRNAITDVARQAVDNPGSVIQIGQDIVTFFRDNQQLFEQSQELRDCMAQLEQAVQNPPHQYGPGRCLGDQQA